MPEWYTKPLCDIQIDFENPEHLMYIHGRYYELSDE
jgi:hypothetical protein